MWNAYTSSWVLGVWIGWQSVSLLQGHSFQTVNPPALGEATTESARGVRSIDSCKYIYIYILKTDIGSDVIGSAVTICMVGGVSDGVGVDV